VNVGVAAHSLILATKEAEIRSMRPTGQKVCKTPSQPMKNLGEVVHTCHPSYTGGINRRIGPGWLDPIAKITKAKRSGGEFYVIECLFYKHKALILNQSTEKKISPVL
jgi:hypothetical protein